MRDSELRQILKATEKKGIDPNKKMQTIIAVTEKYTSMRNIKKPSIIEVIFQHTGYISTEFWIFQLVFLLIALSLAYGSRLSSNMPRTIATISILIPTISIIGFPEIIRSFTYGMWELEQSCRFNLRQLLTIKIFITGAMDLFLFTIASIFTGVSMDVSVFRILLYILVPYNLCALIFLTFFRYGKTKYMLLYSLAMGAGLVSLVQVTDIASGLYGNSMIWLWQVFCVATTIILVVQGYRMISNIKKEGYFKWSLESID